MKNMTYLSRLTLPSLSSSSSTTTRTAVMIAKGGASDHAPPRTGVTQRRHEIETEEQRRKGTQLRLIQ